MVGDRSGLKSGPASDSQAGKCRIQRTTARPPHTHVDFSIRNPYFIVVLCLALMVLGVTAITRMPVDLFPQINIPVVVVATFYSGMPPVDVETDITNPLERFFTQASGLDHAESRSLLGVSIIRRSSTPAPARALERDAIVNLALADLKRLPRARFLNSIETGSSSLWSR